MRIRSTIVVVTIMLLGVSVSVGLAEEIIDWTPCKQFELEGTWDIHVGTSGDECGGEYAVQCVGVEVGYDGMILSGTGAMMQSSCGDEMITGGYLFLTPGCEIEGYIETSQRVMDVERGGFHSYDSLIVDSDIE